MQRISLPFTVSYRDSHQTDKFSVEYRFQKLIIIHQHDYTEFQRYGEMCQDV